MQAPALTGLAGTLDSHCSEVQNDTRQGRMINTLLNIQLSVIDGSAIAHELINSEEVCHILIAAGLLTS
jgi:hypothetical protein